MAAREHHRHPTAAAVVVVVAALFALLPLIVSPQGPAPLAVLHARSLLSHPAVPVPVCHAETALLLSPFLPAEGQLLPDDATLIFLRRDIHHSNTLT
ncbi:hypothetical protein QLX08_006188 [Tetragonisca angustula]